MSNGTKAKQEVILITGASGLIGSRLCDHLKDDYQLLGMDLKSPDDAGLPLDHFDTDLTDDESVRNSLNQILEKHGDKLTSVIHLAAYYDFSGDDSPLYQKLTVEGTQRVLRLLHELEFDVDQFVFSSSMLMMKPNEPGDPITELSEVQAEWAYPESKLKAEEVIRENHGGYPYVILRIAGVYDEKCHSLPISQQMARIYEKQMESYFFPGNEDHGQALIHLDDLATCFQKVVERRKLLGEENVFMVAEPEIMNYGELQDQIGEGLHGDDWPTIRIPKAVAKAGAYVKNQFASEDDPQFIKPWMVDLADANYGVSIAHAKTKLAWEPEHRLCDTLPTMIKFLKDNPSEFYKVNKLGQAPSEGG